MPTHDGIAGNMGFLDLKSEILDQDMCARCGACVAVCPPGFLSISDDHMPVPAVAPDSMSCDDCTLCLDVCPGKDTATPPSETRIFGRRRTPGERWTGIFRQSLVLTSTNPRVLAGAAAGGAGTTFMLTALRSGLADAVIVVGRDANRPWVPAALITDSEDEVIRCGQTSYCLTPNLQLLRDPRFKRIALVGVPCEIQAVRKMQNVVPPPEVAEKVVLTVEIACASSTKLAGTEYLITEKLGIPLKEVTELRYREGEYPGEFTVKTRNGQRRSLPFFGVVDEFKRHKTHRCLVCGDWWSGLADVSISDGDPNIYASSQSGAKPPRQSTVMTRTEQGEKIVQAAVQLGLASVRSRAFISEDNLGLQRKRFRYASFAKAMPNRVPTPPAKYEETETLLSDTEVIDRMAFHMKIAPSQPGEAAAVGRQRAPVTIGFDVTSAREIVWRPPGDKAIAQRVAFAAALADGTSTIRNIPKSDDIESNLSILRQLGVDIWEAADASIVIGGRGLRGLTPPGNKATLSPGNSATTARILISILAGNPGEFRIDGNELLRRRPMEWVVEPLRRAGAHIVYESSRGRLPAHIRGSTLGAISHEVEVFSAQPVSALLFGGLQASGKTVIHRRAKARDHTERLLRSLGVTVDETETMVRMNPPERLPPFNLTLPGDISTASLPIACVVASPLPRRLVIEDVGINETRTGFIRTLQAMGAAIEIEPKGMEGNEPVGRIIVESGHPLRGIDVGGASLVQSMIDELPMLAALVARAEGRTVIRDAQELKDKDTNRITTTVAALSPFDVKIEGREDGFVIEPSELSSAKSLALPPDHRVIFAAMTLASSLEEPTTMSGWEKVSVSFPGCLELLGQLASVSHFEKV
jgi:coenzyme F420 hydrogenase subunit beta